MMNDSLNSSPHAPSPTGSARYTSGATRKAGSSGPAARKARTRSTTTAPMPLPSRPCSTSPARATPPRSPRSCAPGSTGQSPWCGWRATRPCCGGGRTTRSPASTPFPTTPRSKSASRSRFPLGGGCTSSGRRCGRVSWSRAARSCWTPRRPGWSGSPVRRRGSPSSPRSGPTGGPRGTSRRVRTRCGTTRPAAAPCPSGSTWPTSAAKARRTAWAKTRSAPSSVRRSSPRSTPTGTAPGHWTGNATTASSPTSSTPTATYPTSHPA